MLARHISKVSEDIIHELKWFALTAFITQRPLAEGIRCLATTASSIPQPIAGPSKTSAPSSSTRTKLDDGLTFDDFLSGEALEDIAKDSQNRVVMGKSKT
jgi:hypothetical protein